MYRNWPSSTVKSVVEERVNGDDDYDDDTRLVLGRLRLDWTRQQ